MTWRDHGNSLASETHYVGAQFEDARRLMLCAWEGWTSGEPEPEEILEELLATWWAMAMMSGNEQIGELLEAVARDAKP